MEIYRGWLLKTGSSMVTVQRMVLVEISTKAVKGCMGCGGHEGYSVGAQGDSNDAEDREGISRTPSASRRKRKRKRVGKGETEGPEGGKNNRALSRWRRECLDGKA